MAHWATAMCIGGLMLRSLSFVTQSDGRLLKKWDTVNPARDGGKMSKKRELSAKSGKVGISVIYI